MCCLEYIPSFVPSQHIPQPDHQSSLYLPKTLPAQFYQFIFYHASYRAVRNMIITNHYGIFYVHYIILHPKHDDVDQINSMTAWIANALQVLLSLPCFSGQGGRRSSEDRDMSMSSENNTIEPCRSNRRDRSYSEGGVGVGSKGSRRKTKTQKSRIMHIYFYMVDEPKYIPKIFSEPIGPQHINTAFTTSGGDEIILFRLEEWFKVFVHECFHAFSLDFSGVFQEPECVQCMNLNSSILPKPLLLFESFTETWARILYVLMIHVNVKYKNNNGGGTTIPIHSINRSNIMHSIYNLSKLNRIQAHHFLHRQSKSISSFVTAKNSNGINDHSTIRYQEKTNTFAYYIVPSMLLVSLPSFLLWCDQHGVYVGRGLSPNQCPWPSQDPQLKFCEYVGHCFRDVEIQRSMMYVAIGSPHFQINHPSFLYMTGGIELFQRNTLPPFSVSVTKKLMRSKKPK